MQGPQLEEHSSATCDQSVLRVDCLVDSIVNSNVVRHKDYPIQLRLFIREHLHIPKSKCKNISPGGISRLGSNISCN